MDTPNKCNLGKIRHFFPLLHSSFLLDFNPSRYNPPEHNLVYYVPHGWKEKAAGIKNFVSWNNFPLSSRVSALILMPSRFMWGWWPGIGGSDSASPVGVKFLGKVYWGQRQSWWQTRASLATLPPLCVCLWACACCWGERQCHFGVKLLLPPESWGNRLACSIALILWLSVILPTAVSTLIYSAAS